MLDQTAGCMFLWGPREAVGPKQCTEMSSVIGRNALGTNDSSSYLEDATEMNYTSVTLTV